MKRSNPFPKCCRIVLTGGPGGGKTTAADLFRREIGDRVVIVPEAATILFQGGFPRSRERQASRFAQTAIFHVQRHLEDVQAALFPGRTLLCDRGTVDGAVYWPGQPHDYFNAVGTTLDTELARYDAVIFFETAALGGVSIEGGNPVRTESIDEAVRLDGKLRALWSRHPRFILVPHNPSFFKKISFGLAAIEGVVAQLNGEASEKASSWRRHRKQEYPWRKSPCQKGVKLRHDTLNVPSGQQRKPVTPPREAGLHRAILRLRLGFARHALCTKLRIAASAVMDWFHRSNSGQTTAKRRGATGMFRGLIEGDMRAQRSTAPPNHWHHLHVEEVLRLLDVDLKASLSAVEVKRRLEKFGPNVVRPGEARLPGSSFSSSSTNPSFSSCSRSPHKAES